MTGLVPGTFDCWRVTSWISHDSNGPRRWESEPFTTREAAVVEAEKIMRRVTDYWGPRSAVRWIPTCMTLDTAYVLPMGRSRLGDDELAWTTAQSEMPWRADVVGVIRSTITIG